MPVIFKKHLRSPVSRAVRAISECGWGRPWTPRKLSLTLEDATSILLLEDGGYLLLEG